MFLKDFITSFKSIVLVNDSKLAIISGEEIIRLAMQYEGPHCPQSLLTSQTVACRCSSPRRFAKERSGNHLDNVFGPLVIAGGLALRLFVNFGWKNLNCANVTAMVAPSDLMKLN